MLLFPLCIVSDQEQSNSKNHKSHDSPYNSCTIFPSPKIDLFEKQNKKSSLLKIPRLLSHLNVI